MLCFFLLILKCWTYYLAFDTFLQVHGFAFHLKKIVSGGDGVHHNYPKAAVSNVEFLCKDDLTQNIHLHLHPF